MKPFIFLFFLIIQLHCYSQQQADSTSKVKLFPKEYGDKKWKFLLGLDARRSFFAGEKIKINGLKIGAEFKGVHRFGLGFYWLHKSVVFHGLPINIEDAQTPSELRFDLGYTSIFYERIFLKTRWWEIAFPVHLGGGRVSATYRDNLGAMQPYLNKPFSSLLFTTQVKFFPFKWLAIRVSGGYRFNFNTDPEIKQAFNRPFYGFGISVNIMDLYRSIKLNREIRKQKKENQRNGDY